MTALKAILRECVEDPGDDAPRLVLADWLEEHGDADRAEFVRGQLALARAEEDDPARPALEARVKELQDRHFAAWVDSLHGQVGSFWFSRGLMAVPICPDDLPSVRPESEGWDWVERAHLGGAWTPRALARWGESPLASRLVSLDASEVSLKADGARALAAAPWLAHLRSLRLSRNALGNKGAAALAASPHVANLRELDLSHNRIGFEGALALASSPHLSNLTSLVLDYNSVGEAGLAALLTSPHLTRLGSLSLVANHSSRHRHPNGPGEGGGRPASLTRLNLCGNAIGPASAIGLVASPLLARLTALDLSCNSISPAGTAALAASPHLADLTTLNLTACYPGNEGVRLLVRSPHLTRLRDLGLSRMVNDVTAVGVRDLAAWPGLANLTRLALSADAEGAALLARSPHVAGLRELDLSGGDAGDRGAEALAASPHFAGLLRLDLGNNNIGHRGAAALAGSESLAGLRRLGIGGNRIGKVSVAALRRRFGDRIQL